MLQVHGKLSQQDTDNSLGKPVSIFLGLKESVSEAYGSEALPVSNHHLRNGFSVVTISLRLCPSPVIPDMPVTFPA
jgi:hypothetical protein